MWSTMDSHAHMCVSMYVGSLGVEGRRVVYVTFYSTVELREEAWFFLFRGFLEEELCINDVMCTFGFGYIIFLDLDPFI